MQLIVDGITDKDYCLGINNAATNEINEMTNEEIMKAHLARLNDSDMDGTLEAVGLGYNSTHEDVMSRFINSTEKEQWFVLEDLMLK